MNNLSPAAQAVFDAFNTDWPDGLVPALRAAAEQIDHDWSAFNCIDALNEIADELEAQ